MPHGKSFKILIILLIMFTLESCSKKQKAKSPDYSNIIMSHDVPTPVGYRLVESKLVEPKLVESKLVESKLVESRQPKTCTSDEVCYIGKLPVYELVSFYRDSLERMGWDINDLSSNGEGLFFCIKHNKSCAVSIRADKKGSKVHVFMKNNQSSPSEVDINSKQINI